MSTPTTDDWAITGSRHTPDIPYSSRTGAQNDRTLGWADGGYAGALVAWAARHLAGLRLTIVKRSDKAKGFTVIHRRWCVERTLSWITARRRCVRDYERRADTHEAMVRWAMTLVMTRRLARPAPRR